MDHQGFNRPLLMFLASLWPHIFFVVVFTKPFDLFKKKCFIYLFLFVLVLGSELWRITWLKIDVDVPTKRMASPESTSKGEVNRSQDSFPRRLKLETITSGYFLFFIFMEPFELDQWRAKIWTTTHAFACCALRKKKGPKGQTHWGGSGSRHQNFAYE